MYKILHLPVNYFSPRVGRNRKLLESPALPSLPLHGSGFFPGFSAVTRALGNAEGDRREVKSSSTLLMLWQSPFQSRKNLGWPPADLSCTSTEGGSLSLSHTHKKLCGMEMGSTLLSLQIPLPIYFSMTSKVLLLLRKKFAFLQEQLPS